MKRYFPIIGLLLASSVYAKDKVRDFWFNGAEINRYELSQMRYGHAHPGHAEFIFVTEPFLVEQQVKQEFGTGQSTDVLKLNALRTFNTGIYSYRTMTSTFRPIDLTTYPHALKTATSVQDWCGHAYQQINRQKDGWALQLRSYFQAEGDRDDTLPDVWLEDELWLLVRLDPQKLPRGEVAIIPGAVFTRFAHQPVQAYAATARLKPGPATSTYILKYPKLQRELHLTFDTEFPHIIRNWEAHEPDGVTRAILRHRLMNSSYWSEHQPDDAQKRRSLGLAPVAD